MQRLADIVIVLIRAAFVLTLLLVTVIEQMRAGDTLHVSLHYPQGSAKIYPGFASNDSALLVLKILSDPRYTVRKIEIVSGSSPEGNTNYNKELSQRRSESAAALVRSIFRSDTLLMIEESIGIDWEELANHLSQSDDDWSSRALDIVRNTPEWIVSDGAVTDGRKLQLRSLDDGRFWATIGYEIFPLLRMTRLTVEYDENPISARLTYCDHAVTECLPVGDMTYLSHANIPYPGFVSANKSFRLRIALITNVLYDVLAVPNIGVAVTLPRGFVVGMSGMYAWWRNSDRSRYRRAQGAEVSVKRYFGRRLMSGHHAGLYGSLFRYDFTHYSSGQLSGGAGSRFFDHPSWSVGVDYGYSLSLGDHLRLDLTAGFGYLAGRYMTYRIDDGHSIWLSTRQRKWLGPTKAEISLVWVIGKGGER